MTLFKASRQLNQQQDEEIMISISRCLAVPMNGSGDYLAMHCCQIASAVKMYVIEVETGALLNIVLDYGNNCCCQEIWHNFIL